MDGIRMAKKKEIELTVAEARYQNDVGRNLVPGEFRA